MKIYRANILHTPTPDRLEIIPRGYVVVGSDGLVEGVYTELPENLDWRRQVMDFGDKLLIPAFNDLHVHAPQYRNMGLALDLELLPWLNTYTFPEETKYADPEYARRLYRRFVHELWMQGTMRSAVFATIHPEATRILADLFIQAGMGAYVGLVGMNRNSPETLQNTTAEVMEGMRMLKKHLDEHNPSGLVRPIITPRFVPSCSDKMLTALGEYATETGLPVQSHLSENRSEIDWVKELEPESTCYGDAYNRYGLFGQTPTLMAHCCYTDGEEMELMKKNGVYVVHCPMSNSNLSSGMAPIRKFLNAGINVALGTDVSAGHHMSMLRVMQYAIQVSKLNYAQTKGEMPFLSLSEVFYLATKGGGSFFGKVGSFEPGYEFDALLVDDAYLNYDHYTLPQRLERYIYLGDDRDIKRRFCRGVELSEPVL
ncbi:MAG: amidohydrolase family protein [Paludibacteraceae bacterium]|nr:amidohydrolase family protein [Paludibacteraceae bacterium]